MDRTRLALMALSPVLFMGMKAGAQTNGCKAFLIASETDHRSTTAIKAQNVSKQPIVAYVITNTPANKGDTKAYSLHGVFTDGDSLHPRQAMQLGTIPKRQVNGLLKVDYVRLADGTSCGPASTQDAKQVAARFE